MIDEKLIALCESRLKNGFEKAEEICQFNQEKVLNAFKKNRIALRHFSGSSGYGYGDEGRETLNSLFADIFGAEEAICSPYIVSGTHAISLCLFGVLRPGDCVLSITGNVYDTLNGVISGENGSLSEYGVTFNKVDFKDGKFDFDGILRALSEFKPKMVYMQRSRGYEWRSALSVSEIGNAVTFLRENGFNGCIMLDNCYGEFIETTEAPQVGVDLCAGSMIKNPGGGIAPTGGYVAGKRKYVQAVYNRLTAPSIGSEVGSYEQGYRYFYQGLFTAPHTVLQAVKGEMLFSAVLSELGYKVSPKSGEIPKDIITMIEFGDKDKLISFIRAVQSNSPIDSFVQAYPWSMPGYAEEVIMAAGCFVQGSSLELSADAPIKPPYIAYMQGGLTYEHCKAVIKNLDI